MADFSKAIVKTLEHEGGYDHKRKTGEVVNRGITHWTLRALKYPGMQWDAHRSVPANAVEVQVVKNLTLEETYKIYREEYWDKNRLGELVSQAVAEKVFDLQVNTGRGVKFLQRALNAMVPVGQLVVDGRMGPKTLREANTVEFEELLTALRKEAKAHYQTLAAKEPELHTENLKGWLVRLDS